MESYKYVIDVKEYVAKLKEEAKQLEKKRFVTDFNKAKGLIVLCSKFREDLQKWGIKVPIYLTTTKVNNSLIEGYDNNKFRKHEIKKILFLSRIERQKGIIEALQTFQILIDQFQLKRKNLNILNFCNCKTFFALFIIALQRSTILMVSIFVGTTVL